MSVIVIFTIGRSLFVNANDVLEHYPELAKLKQFDPTLELHLPSSFSPDEMYPSPNQLNILFTALRYCQHDLTTMRQEFPELSAIFHPQAIDDLDGDGEIEVIMDLSGYIDSTWIWVAEHHAETFRYVEYKEDCPMVSEIRITHQKEIELRRQKSKHIPIKGTNNLVTIEFILQTLLTFSGDEFHVIRSCEVVEECLVP